VVVLSWLRGEGVDRDDNVTTEQRTATKLGIKTIRPFSSLPCEQVRYQIYTNGSLSSNDCARRIGHLWGVVAEFSRLPAGARRVDYATGGSTFGRFRGYLSLEDTSGIVKEELGRWVQGTAGVEGSQRRRID